MLLKSPKQHGNYQDESRGFVAGLRYESAEPEPAYLEPVQGPPFSTGEGGRKGASEGLGVISEKTVKL